ncbi:MAG: ABC transporter substrate-binding protein [Desertimonas sp.]
MAHKVRKGSAMLAVASAAAGIGSVATATTPPSEPPSDGWVAPTDDCIDADRVHQPIEGTLTIGSAMPLSGGAAASAFAPIAAGFQAYIEYANDHELVPGITLAVEIADDQFNPALTPAAVNGLLDEGAHVISSALGTPNNLAVRELLNDECVPQLLAVSGAPVFAEAEEYPWTIGGQMPYPVEVAGYLRHAATAFPDGASIGMFYVNSEFGDFYRDALSELAGEYGFEQSAQQTVEASETGPPTAQVNALAADGVDIIVAVPLGAGCPTFLTELANAKAANPGWEPVVYLTSACSQPAILAAAGAAADGVLTVATGGLVDPVAAASAELPAVQEYLADMDERGLTESAGTAATGWVLAEVTVAAIAQAAESPEGLTQASIMTAARHLDMVPGLARDGVRYTTNGLEDQYYVESVQVVRYDAANTVFVDEGPLDDLGIGD